MADIDTTLTLGLSALPGPTTAILEHLIRVRGELAKLAGRDLLPVKLWTAGADEIEPHFDEPLGMGGFGPQFGGLLRGRRVTVEVLPRVHSKEVLVTAAKEAEEWFVLCHENVVSLMAFSVNADAPVLALQAFRCRLDAVLRSGLATGLSVNTRIGFIFGIAKGLRYLHSMPKPLVHGDLRACNVTLGFEGEVAIGNVGMQLTRALFKPGAGRQSSSIRWVAPERYRRGYKPAPPMDVFAFAMTAIEILTGSAPFLDEEPEDEIVKDWIRDGERPARPAGVPDDLWHVLVECWHPDPERRPTAADVVKRMSLLPMASIRPPPLFKQLDVMVPSHTSIPLEQPSPMRATSARKRPPSPATEAIRFMSMDLPSRSNGRESASASASDAAADGDGDADGDRDPAAGATAQADDAGHGGASGHGMDGADSGSDEQLTDLDILMRAMPLWAKSAKRQRGSMGPMSTAEWLQIRPSDRPTVVHDDENRIRILYFRNMYVDGTLPRKIHRLSHAEIILYENNSRLVGSIPPTIGSLSNLTVLILAKNGLAGEIPASIGMLSNLTELCLNHNQLTGKIPREICRLTKLVTLSLYHNQLAGSIPESIGRLTVLKNLYLNSNQLTGPIPSCIGSLTELVQITIDNNFLSGPLPAGFRELEKVRHLARKGRNILAQRRVAAEASEPKANKKPIEKRGKGGKSEKRAAAHAEPRQSGRDADQDAGVQVRRRKAPAAQRAVLGEGARLLRDAGIPHFDVFNRHSDANEDEDGQDWVERIRSNVFGDYQLNSVDQGADDEGDFDLYDDSADYDNDEHDHMRGHSMARSRWKEGEDAAISAARGIHSFPSIAKAAATASANADERDAVAVEHGDNPDDVQPANGQAPQHPPRPGQQPLRSEPHGDSREPAHHDLGDRQNLQPQQQQVPPPPPQQQHLNHQKQPHQAHQAQPPSKQRDGRADKPAPRESQPNRQSGQMRIHINVAIRAANACMSNTAEIEPNRLAVGLLRIRIQKLAAALHALLSAPGIDPHTPPSEAAVAAAAAAQPGGRRSWVSETAKAAAASAAVPSSIALPALEALAALLAQIARFLKRQASKTPLRQLLQHRTAAARVAMLDSQLLGLAEPLLIDLIVVDMSMRPSIQRDYDLLRDLMPLIAKAHIVQTQLVETLYDIDVVIQNQMADFPVHMHTGLWAALTSARSALATLAGRDLVPYKVWSVNPDDVEILFDQLIGHGSIGPIYKGLYNNLDVAIQMAPFVSSVEAAHTFAAEAEAWFLLRHPNVLGLWHFCVNVDLPFLVLPLLRSSISAHLRSQSKTDVAVRMGFIFGIAKGMRYLHGLPVPIVHGDLRASNVLLGYDGEVAITDVGMSLTKAHCKPSPGRQSSSIRWVAPERYRRGYKPAPPLDVFAFAMTCWEVITGRAPFFEEPEDEIVKDWIRDGERPPRVSIIPDTLWEVMQDCWQPDPEKRPTSTQILFRLSTTPISRPLVVDFPYVQPLQRALNEATGSNNAIAHTAAAIKHNTSSKNRALAAAFSKRMPTSITMASHTLCVPDTSVSRTKLLASERVKGMTIKPVAALQPPPEMVLEINPEATAALAPRLPASVVSAATTVSNVGRGPNRRPDRQGPTSSGYHSYDRTARGPRAAQYSQAKTADKLGRRAATAPSRRKTSTHVEPTESDSMPSDNEPPRKRMSLPAASKRSHNSNDFFDISAGTRRRSSALERREPRTASLDAPSARKRASDTDRFLSIFSSISKRLKIRKDNFYKYSAVTTLAEWLAQVPSKRFRIGKNEKDNFTIM
nr:hypothetical protein HK105_004521 [Polyrhizophydium stewartii]